MKRSGIITLTTDFGLGDPYVGVMKGVILSINPEIRLVDISHQIKVGDIPYAANILQESYHFFPKGTIHVAVVDPGVGGKRRPIMIGTKDYVFVGPDNGIFWPIVKAQHHVYVIHLTEKKYFLPRIISRTFHGRDIFAPVAAHLSCGIDPLKMGRKISDPTPLTLPSVEQKGNRLLGQITRVDNFGNLITNIHKEDLLKFLEGEKAVITVGDLIIEHIKKTYSEAITGEPVALIGSSDCLEISVNLGRASDQLGINSEQIVGMEVEVRQS